MPVPPLCRSRDLLAALAMLVAALAPPHVGAQQLSEIKSWAFQLQNVDPIEIRVSPYDLVGSIASYARAQRKDFLIVPQNGDDLLANPTFVRAIDGFAREDLLYSEKDDDVRNTQRSIAESIRRLRPLVTAGKTVLVVEY